MSPRSGPDLNPLAWLADGEEWPNGALIDSAPVEALAAREAARRTLTALLERHDDVGDALSELPPAARRAGGQLITGYQYPDVADFAALEQSIGSTLWPSPGEIPPASDRVATR